jgi:hypothetical protein
MISTFRWLAAFNYIKRPCNSILFFHSCKFTRDIRAPNITGNINMAYAWGGLAEAGALYKSETTRGPGGGADNGTNMYINAAKSSSIYGSSSSVQPPSMALLACIKI